MCETTYFILQSRDAVEAKVRSCAAQCDLWKADHDKAMEVLDLQDVITEILAAFEFINKVDRYYGKFVRQYPDKYDYAVDESLKASYRSFLEEASELLQAAQGRIREGWTLDIARDLGRVVARMQRSAERDFDGESFDMASELTPAVETLRRLSSRD